MVFLCSVVANKLGERAGVRGHFSHAAFLESPLIRPVGHLLPRFRGRRDGGMTQRLSEQYHMANLTIKVALSN
jgi:hypothetical protein